VKNDILNARCKYAKLGKLWLNERRNNGERKLQRRIVVYTKAYKFE
jgi:hypothetical protein